MTNPDGPGDKAIKIPAKDATVLSISYLNDKDQKVTENQELAGDVSFKTRGFKITVTKL